MDKHEQLLLTLEAMLVEQGRGDYEQAHINADEYLLNALYVLSVGGPHEVTTQALITAWVETPGWYS